MAPSLSSKFRFICVSSCSFSTRRSSRSRTWKKDMRKPRRKCLPSICPSITHHILDRYGRRPLIRRRGLPSVGRQSAQGRHTAAGNLPYGSAPRPYDLWAHGGTLQGADGVDMAHGSTDVKSKAGLANTALPYRPHSHLT